MLKPAICCRLGIQILCLMALLTAPFGKPSRANTIEDMFGLGSYAKSMGGAGTALSKDFSSIYYNPANLAFCQNTKTSISYFHLDYGLGVDVDASDVELEALDSRDVFSVGICVPLPFDLAFGFHFSMNLQQSMVISQQSIDSIPRYSLYGKWLDGISIMFGFAYRIFDNLSVGGGLSILANSDLLVDNDIPVATAETVRDRWVWKLKPTAAVYLGVQYEPTHWLALGFSYRSALYHKLDCDTQTQIEIMGVQMDFDMLLQSVAWYSPQQAALGWVITPASGWTVAFDLTWYDWSEYPGPFIYATPDPDSSISPSVDFPERELVEFSDTVVPRLGVEYLHTNKLAFRLGYGLRFTPASVPAGRANVLDGDTHSFAVGLGYLWDLSQPTDEASTGEKIHAPQIGFDIHLCYYYMPDTEVTKDHPQDPLKNYSFGGSIFDAGLTVKLEY